MKTYKVFWTMRKSVLIEAKNTEEAIDIVWKDAEVLKNITEERISDIDAIDYNKKLK